MIYISTNVVQHAILNLKEIHPFQGITFLACKRSNLPIGKKIQFKLDAITKELMDQVHKISPDSSFYYQPFRTNDKGKKWVKFDYPSSGLQAVNTRTFRDAFIHEKKHPDWGWNSDYINIIDRLIKDYKKPNIYDIAIWLYKDKDFEEASDISTIKNIFINEFNITEDEKERLFIDDLPCYIDKSLFQENKISWNDYCKFLDPPPDEKPDEEGALVSLELENVGPTNHILMQLTNRLNVITGDNGLGKTFLMDCAWWALTGTWIGEIAIPKTDKKSVINFEIAGKSKKSVKKSVSYDKQNSSWKRDHKIPTIPGLIIYGRVDNSYAIWDPIKQCSFIFSNEQVWFGKDGSIEGLIRDWIKWQTTKSLSIFEIFENVLAEMSPPDLGKLKAGKPIRTLKNIREIPTIEHPYGEIPITQTSAGIRRIITLVYLIVWAWNEHKINADLRGISTDSRIYIMVDEIEFHLHPKWQRTIIPSLLKVQSLLSKELEIQFLISTHSPLALASLEPLFDSQKDSLFHMELTKDGQDAILQSIDFIKYGVVDSWLTSPIFNMLQARSQEAESTIEEAKKLQLQNNPQKEKIMYIHQKLLKCLSQDDAFWRRWIYFAECNGVKI